MMFPSFICTYYLHSSVNGTPSAIHESTKLLTNRILKLFFFFFQMRNTTVHTTTFSVTVLWCSNKNCDKIKHGDQQEFKVNYLSVMVIGKVNDFNCHSFRAAPCNRCENYKPTLKGPLPRRQFQGHRVDCLNRSTACFAILNSPVLDTSD